MRVKSSTKSNLHNNVTNLPFLCSTKSKFLRSGDSFVWLLRCYFMLLREQPLLSYVFSFLIIEVLHGFFFILPINCALLSFPLEVPSKIIATTEYITTTIYSENYSQNRRKSPLNSTFESVLSLSLCSKKNKPRTYKDILSRTFYGFTISSMNSLISFTGLGDKI